MHNHSHHNGNLLKTKQTAFKTLFFSLLANILLCLIKWVAGILGNSNALIADAIESSLDTIFSLVIVIGMHFAFIPEDDQHPYGHGRIETFISVALSVFLMCSAGLILFRGIHALGTPRSAPKYYTFIMLLVVVIWKEICYRTILKRSKETHSSALKTEAWHQRSDAITSLAGVIGVGLSFILGPGYEYFDDIAAIAAGLYILGNSIRILIDAFRELMDSNTHSDIIEQVEKACLSVPGAIETEQCLVRKYGTQYHVDLHLVVDGSITVIEGHDLSHAVKNHIIKEIPIIRDVLIHIEPKK